MNELKPLDIAQQFCRYVQLECTGNRKEFAERLGISQAWVTVYKRKIEQLCKVEIAYSRKRQTYYIKESGLIDIYPLN